MARKLDKANVSVGLVHYPIMAKDGNIVATNVTNLDVHDIGRAARVYGIEKYFIINPMKEQLFFVNRILEFWRMGAGATYNPMRKTALGSVIPVESIAEAVKHIGGTPRVIGTSARAISGTPIISFRDLRRNIQEDGGDYLLLFGTGFGMAESIFSEFEATLEPIRGESEEDYRHLSVRSAVSICLDRLLGTW